MVGEVIKLAVSGYLSVTDNTETGVSLFLSFFITLQLLIFYPLHHVQTLRVSDYTSYGG